MNKLFKETKKSLKKQGLNKEEVNRGVWVDKQILFDKRVYAEDKETGEIIRIYNVSDYIRKKQGGRKFKNWEAKSVIETLGGAINKA